VGEKGLEAVLPVLDVIDRLTTIKEPVKGRTIIESPTTTEIAAVLKDTQEPASTGYVYSVIMEAEGMGLLVWPMNERGRTDRRKERGIVITEKGREELEAWRKEQMPTV
jgi:DNA-binding PadR family transcriptional regulator